MFTWAGADIFERQRSRRFRGCLEVVEKGEKVEEKEREVERRMERTKSHDIKTVILIETFRGQTFGFQKIKIKIRTLFFLDLDKKN